MFFRGFFEYCIFAGWYIWVSMIILLQVGQGFKALWPCHLHKKRLQARLTKRPIMNDSCGSLWWRINCKCMCGYGGLFVPFSDLSCNVFVPLREFHFHFKTRNCNHHPSGFCFIFPQFFCDVHNNIGDHPQEELAKFGYKSERKVEFLMKKSGYFIDET